MSALSTPSPAIGPSAAAAMSLVERIRGGENAAWEEFVRENVPRMLAVARRLLRCEEDAADAIQEAFVSAYKSMGEFESRSQLCTWIHRIVVNACLMHLRKHKRTGQRQPLSSFDERARHSQLWHRSTNDPSEDAERSDLRQTVRLCIDQLPEPYRSTLMLRDIEQFNTEATADLMDCSVECVKSRLHRARSALRTLLEPLYVQGTSPSSRKSVSNGAV